MAKSLVRNRHAVTKMYALKSQLQAVSLRIQVSMQGSARAVLLPDFHSRPAQVNFVHIVDIEVYSSNGRCHARSHKGMS